MGEFFGVGDIVVVKSIEEMYSELGMKMVPPRSGVMVVPRPYIMNEYMVPLCGHEAVVIGGGTLGVDDERVHVRWLDPAPPPDAIGIGNIPWVLNRAIFKLSKKADVVDVVSQEDLSSLLEV